MDTVASKDGTQIAFSRSGEGPPLLLVHGAVADHTTTWRLVRPLLEDHFTVYAMDRRGRGASGDSHGYRIEREAEDIAAVIAAIEEPANVLGHSYGALCALEASLLTHRLRRLILYEGIYQRGADVYPPGLIDRLEAMLTAGNAEEMLVTMLRELVGLSPDDIRLLRSQREAWATRLGNASTIPRELSADQQYCFSPERFGTMRQPTLLLVGSDSPRRELDNAHAVAAGLPDARVLILPGQQHIAMHTAPELFVREVLHFLA